MWTINGTRIYVTDIRSDEGAVIARLQPLDDSTVLHFFGTEAEIYKVGCYIVGKTNLDAVRALKANSSAYVLTDGDDFTINCYVSKVGATRTNSVWQTIDQTQDCTTPVYKVDLEIYV